MASEEISITLTVNFSDVTLEPSQMLCINLYKLSFVDSDSGSIVDSKCGISTVTFNVDSYWYQVKPIWNQKTSPFDPFLVDISSIEENVNTFEYTLPTIDVTLPLSSPMNDLSLQLCVDTSDAGCWEVSLEGSVDPSFTALQLQYASATLIFPGGSKEVALPLEAGELERLALVSLGFPQLGTLTSLELQSEDGRSLGVQTPNATETVTFYLPAKCSLHLIIGLADTASVAQTTLDLDTAVEGAAYTYTTLPIAGMSSQLPVIQGSIAVWQTSPIYVEPLESGHTLTLPYGEYTLHLEWPGGSSTLDVVSSASGIEPSPLSLFGRVHWTQIGDQHIKWGVKATATVEGEAVDVTSVYPIGDDVITWEQYLPLGAYSIVFTPYGVDSPSTSLDITVAGETDLFEEAFGRIAADFSGQSTVSCELGFRDDTSGESTTGFEFADSISDFLVVYGPTSTPYTFTAVFTDTPDNTTVLSLGAPTAVADPPLIKVYVDYGLYRVGSIDHIHPNADLSAQGFSMLPKNTDIMTPDFEALELVRRTPWGAACLLTRNQTDDTWFGFDAEGASCDAGIVETAVEPWSSLDIGAVNAVGSSSQVGATFTLTGSGNDIWSSKDEFRFTYMEVSGDITVVAKVVTHDPYGSLTRANSWSKSGIMIRDTLDTASKHVSLFETTSNGIASQYRSKDGGSSSHRAYGQKGVKPIWFKLARVGDKVSEYYSLDGAAWSFVRTVTVGFTDPVYAGLALTSHQDGKLVISTYSEVSVTPSASIEGQSAPVANTNAIEAKELWEDGVNFRPAIDYNRIMVVQLLDVAGSDAPVLTDANTFTFREVRYGALNAADVDINPGTIDTKAIPRKLPAGYSLLTGTQHAAFPFLGTGRRFGATGFCLAGLNGDGVDGSYAIDSISGEQIADSTPCFEIVGDGYHMPLNPLWTMLLSQAAPGTTDEWSPEPPASYTNKYYKSSLKAYFAALDNSIVYSSNNKAQRHPLRAIDSWTPVDMSASASVYVVERTRWQCSCVVGSSGIGLMPWSGSKICSSGSRLYSAVDPLDNSIVYFPSDDTATILVSIAAPTYAVCASTGDPHLRTFDGSRWDIHGEGDYQIAAVSTNDWSLDVQFRLRQWGPVGVTHAVGVQLTSVLNASLDCTVEFFANNKSVDDSDIHVFEPFYSVNKVVNGSCDAFDIDVLSTDSDGYIRSFQVKSSETFEIQHSLSPRLLKLNAKPFVSSKRGTMLNTWTTLSSDAMGAAGVCGTYTGTSADDLTLPDGTITDKDGRHATGLRDYWAACTPEAVADGTDRFHAVSMFTPALCDYTPPPAPEEPSEDDDNYDNAKSQCELQGLSGTALDECIQDVLAGGDDLADAAGDADTDTDEQDNNAGVCSASAPVPIGTGYGWYWAWLGAADDGNCMAGSHAIALGWAIAPLDAATLQALSAFAGDSDCVGLSNNNGYNSLGSKCSSYLVREQEECYSVRECPGSVLLRRVDPSYVDPTGEPVKMTDWYRTRSETAIPEASQIDLDTQDVIDLAVLLGASTADIPTTALPVSCEVGGAYRSVTLEAGADISNSLSLPLCMKLTREIVEMDPLYRWEDQWWPQLSFYVDAEYRHNSDGDDLSMYGLRRPFDPRSVEWQCRTLTLPLIHPSVSSEDADDYTPRFWVNVFFELNEDACQTATGAQFLLGPSKAVSDEFIMDPTCDDWQQVTMADYRVYPEDASVSYNDGCIEVASGGRQVIVQQTIYFSNKDGPGFTDTSSLLLTACSTAHPTDPEAVLAHALYADIRYDDGEWDFGWFTSFTGECAQLHLPGGKDGKTVTTVEAHVVVDSPEHVVSVCSMSLTPQHGVANPSKPAVNYGDPHLQSIKGHTFDWHASGTQMLTCLSTPDVTARVDIHNRPVISGDYSTPSVTRAVGVEWGLLTNGNCESGPFMSSLVVNADESTPSVVLDGLTLPVMGEDDAKSYSAGSAVVTVHYPNTTVSATSVSDPLQLSVTLTTGGISMSFDVYSSSSDELYINTAIAGTPNTCEGILGTCESVEADKQLIDDAFTAMADGEPSPFLVSNSVIPAITSDPLFTSSPGFGENEAADLCASVGLSGTAFDSCVLDAITAGVLPAGVVASAYPADSKLTSFLPYGPEDVEEETGMPAWVMVLIGAAGLAAVFGVVRGVKSHKRKNSNVLRRKSKKTLSRKITIKKSPKKSHSLKKSRAH